MFRVSIPENVPFGTPLANLNMEVKDPDTGANSLFSLRYTDQAIIKHELYLSIYRNSDKFEEILI